MSQCALVGIDGVFEFRLLVDLGMKPDDTVLEVGCGSLGVGRFLLPYLGVRHYYAIEFDEGLVEMGLERHLGRDILLIKQPYFYYQQQVNLKSIAAQFEYVLMSSAFANTSKANMRQVFSQLRWALSQDGLTVVSFEESTQSRQLFVQAATDYGFMMLDLHIQQPHNLSWAVVGTKRAMKALIERNPEIVEYGDEEELRQYGAFGVGRQRLEALGFSERKTYVVLGMHRSGTSFVARALYEAGVDMGEGALMGGNEQNKLGHAENAAFVQLNSQILQAADEHSWWGTPDKAVVAKQALRRADDFRALIEEWQRPFWGFKDPRMILTGEALLPLLPAEDDVYLICCFRKPDRVVDSMVYKRDVDREEAVASVDEHNRRLVGIIKDFVGLD